MSRRTALVTALAMSVLVPVLDAEESVAPPKPPVAKKIARSITIHGDTLQDDYFWMREKKDPQVRAYLEAENAYTDAVMKPTEPLQKTLYAEMLGRIKETDLSVPFRDRGYFYYSRTEQGKAYPIYCRKKTLDAPEEIVLDVNELARGEKFMSVGAWRVSDDGNSLAYTTDKTGFRDYDLHVKDLKTGRVLPDTAERVRSVAWAADNKTIFYATTDLAKRPNRLWRHSVGTDTKGDTLLHEEKDEMFGVGVHRSRSGEYLFFESGSLTTSEVRYLKAEAPTAPLRMVAPRVHDREYLVDHRGDMFYVLTNDRGRNKRLVVAPASDPRPENWKELIAHRDDVMLEDFDLFAGWGAVYERQDALPRISILDFKTGATRRLEFPEAIYSAGAENNREFDTNRLRIAYESFTTPPSVYDYDVVTGEKTLLKRREVLGGYDPSRYTSERRYATASDGTKIPISIVYRKGFVADGKAPLLLGAYGSYGAPSDVEFDSNEISLLDRGFVLALAHIRGGGDLGKKWHDQGRMLSKKNTFTDFIASAEQLIADRYTSRDRLAIEGGSAGGLLMGAVTNMRPDLFKVVLSHVPFVDVINTMLDESVPLTVPEFEEWGNPKIREQYVYMRSYSPYDNIAGKDYPTILVKTSWDDSQVMYWEPAKYVAKLRAMKTDRNPLLFKINMAGGHGGSSGRYDKLRERAFDQAFLLRQLGIDGAARENAPAPARTAS
ncbi:MAG: S9 family peptidase [Acidobacteriota bacterium]